MKVIGFFVVGFLMIIGSAFATPVNIGSGSAPYQARKAVIRNYVESYYGVPNQNELASFATNHNAYYDYIGNWCSNTENLLRFFKKQAGRQGKFAGKRDKLLLGLEVALEAYIDNKIPMQILTFNSIRRAIQINNDLTDSYVPHTTNPETLARAGEYENHVAVNFLAHVYEFIIYTTKNLDKQYSLPYYRRWKRSCKNCSNAGDYGNYGDYEMFQSNFKIEYARYANKLLDFTNSRVQEMGRNIYELIMLRNILKWAAEDLDFDLFRRDFLCISNNLNFYSNEIERYLLCPLQSTYESQVDLIFDVRDTIERASNDLNAIVSGKFVCY